MRALTSVDECERCDRRDSDEQHSLSAEFVAPATHAHIALAQENRSTRETFGGLADGPDEGPVEVAAMRN